MPYESACNAITGPDSKVQPKALNPQLSKILYPKPATNLKLEAHVQTLAPRIPDLQPTLNPTPPPDQELTSLTDQRPYLEGQADLVSRLITL